MYDIPISYNAYVVVMFDVNCVICSAYTKLFWTNYGVDGGVFGIMY